jgi:hypothetical protein
MEVSWAKVPLLWVASGRSSHGVMFSLERKRMARGTEVDVPVVEFSGGGGAGDPGFLDAAAAGEADLLHGQLEVGGGGEGDGSVGAGDDVEVG